MYDVMEYFAYTQSVTVSNITITQTIQMQSKHCYILL